MQIQYRSLQLQLHLVVICFKFSNFAYANTVYRQIDATVLQLLFALNLVTLLMQIQYESSKRLIMNAL